MPIKQIKVRAALELYYTESPRWLGYSDSYRRACRSSLEALLKVCDSQTRVNELGSAHFEQALKLRATPDPEDNERRRRIGIKQRGVRSESAIGSDIKAYKGFIKFCHEREYLGAHKNPVGHLKSAPPSQRRAKVTIEKMVVQPTKDVFEVLLDAAGKRHPRDRMVVALGLFAGLRQSEILALRVDGLDFDKTTVRNGKRVPAPEVRVWRKKVKDWHRVPMRKRLQQEAKRWLAWLEKEHGPADPNWFVIGTRRSGLEGVRRDGKFLCDTGPLTPDCPVDPTTSPTSLVKDVQAAFKEAGYGDIYRCGPHTLRRMGAIFVRDNAKDPDAAQYFLGHKSRQTTEIYLQWSNKEETLRNALRDMDGDTDVTPEEDSVPNNVVQLFRSA